jgi:hypothetical protein
MPVKCALFIHLSINVISHICVCKLDAEEIEEKEKENGIMWRLIICFHGILVG